MAKVKLDLKNLSDLQTVQLATNIKTAMTGNPNFVTPVPPLATITTLTAAGQTGISNSETAYVLAKQRTLEKPLAIDALKAGRIQLSNYAVATVNGDASKLASAGFGIALQTAGARPCRKSKTFPPPKATTMARSMPLGPDQKRPQLRNRIGPPPRLTRPIGATA